MLGPGGGQRQASEAVGEIRYVDTRAQRIELRGQDGRTGTVRFDNRTRVVYQGREYPVTALEPGDVVALRVEADGRGDPVATLIEVRQSVQERTGAGGTPSTGVQLVEGRVGSVDVQRGTFEIQQTYGQPILVSLPYNAGRREVDRLRALRRGDHVRVEGRLVSQQRLELERFR